MIGGSNVQYHKVRPYIPPIQLIKIPSQNKLISQTIRQPNMMNKQPNMVNKQPIRLNQQPIILNNQPNILNVDCI